MGLMEWDSTIIWPDGNFQWYIAAIGQKRTFSEIYARAALPPTEHGAPLRSSGSFKTHKKRREVYLDDPLSQAKAKAAATYDAAADHFDDEPLAFWERIGRRTVERLKLPTGAKVLDVGCGTGASALPAAQAVGLSGSVIGVDLSSHLLDRARAKATTQGLSNIDFRLADMTALGYPDGDFDAVVSVFSVFFVPDMEGLVRELWRMVRPGGKLAVTTWGPRIFEPAYSRWQSAIKQERPDLYCAFNPWDRITDVESVRRLLRDGGATKIDVIGENGFQALRTPEDWWTIALGSGLRWAINQMGPKAAARMQVDNVNWLHENKIERLETNAIYAIGHRGA
jgi:ubiquinone/menaquinone biosynthesis C-methylase UbiE